MIHITKTAGMIIDQQDDPGFFFEENFKNIWPEDLPFPSVGITKEGGIANINGEYKFPVNEPEDALLSAMYLQAAADHFSDEEFDKIASDIDQYLVIHGYEWPIVDYISKEATMRDLYADSTEHLPVTTPEQTVESAHMFEKYASRWKAAEQVAIAHNLKQAAMVHGVDVNVRNDGSIDISPGLDTAIELRKKAMLERVTSGDDLYEEYIDALDQMGENVFEKVARLEQLDEWAGMDQLWGRAFPDPVDSVIRDIFEKKAASKWASADFNKLKGVLDDNVVDAISDDPDTIIPTLPLAQRQLVEDVLNEE